MDSLRHRSAEPLSQYKALVSIPTYSTEYSAGRRFNWDYAPLVEAAWCLTAARSRLNSLSTIQEGLASEELKRRWAAERAC